MGQKINSFELSASNRCDKRRNFSLVKTERGSDEFSKKAKEVKTILREALLNHWDKATIIAETQVAFENLEFPTEKTRNIQAKDMALCIERYARCETRTPLPESAVESMELPIWDFDVNIKPDYIFYTNQGLEIVKIKTSKPKISAFGQKRDSSANKCLELYALFCYGRAIVPKGKSMQVTASYYYLRKSNDSVNKNHFDLDFFDDTGKNVVSLKDTVAKNDKGVSALCSLDEIFRPQFEEFFTGDTECEEEDCKTCDFYHICNYKYSPQYVVKEHKVKSLSDLALTPQQETAIAFEKGVARINAGAGAGKTLVVALRVVTLLLKGYKPEDILMLTFTNTGAGEMAERVQLYNDDFGTGTDTSKMTITTFNAFANDIVVKEYDKLGFLEPPTLIDDIERADIISSVLRGTTIDGLDYRNFYMNSRYCKGALPVASLAFNIIKTYKLSIGDEPVLQKHLGTNIRFMSLTALPQLLKAYGEYDKLLKQGNLIEYADQELLLFELLRQDPYYLEKLNFKHIIVDEFQDSNQQQLELIQELRDCPAFESLMVVGDDSQAIFSFRDTSPEFIINFFDIMEVDEKDRADFYLLENHRSTPEIIKVANELNNLNVEKVDKELIATRESGKPVVVRGFYTNEEEDSYICEKILEKIKGGTKSEDIAYVAADRYALLDMGSRLTEAGVPWVMLNPEPVLENAKVIAAISLAKAVDDPRNTEGMLTYLNALYTNELLHKKETEINRLVKGLKKEIEHIHNLPEAEKQKAFHDLIEPLDDDDELYERFLETIKRRKTFTAELKYMKDYELYGEKITFKRCRDYPGIVLTTAHSSKGLEWPIVFCSLTKYDYAELYSGPRGKKIEEKRRLVFVSLTRAKDELYVTSRYIAFGDKKNRSYNKFLHELYDITGQVFNPIDPMEEEREKEARKKARERAKERRERQKKDIEQKSLEETMKEIDAAMEAEEAANATDKTV